MPTWRQRRWGFLEKLGDLGFRALEAGQGFNFALGFLDGGGQRLAKVFFQRGGVNHELTGRIVKMDFFQLFKPARGIQFKVFAHGIFRDAAQFGNQGMREIMALQPKYFHPRWTSGTGW